MPRSRSPRSRIPEGNRLALAYRKLRSHRFSARTISSVAHDAGFGDLSYFNRTFRRRYGIAPSDARPRTDPRSSGPA